MDSAVLFFEEAVEEDVAEFLNSSYSNSGKNWYSTVDGDPALYIDVLNDPENDMEPGHWLAAVAALGRSPSLCLIAHLSGRHFGSQEPNRFAIHLLTRFPGIALDDYSDLCWTKSDLIEDRILSGRRFFKREPV
jgi:hypothetical protein